MLKLWWLFLIIKLAVVAFVPQTADENYYWVWSQNLALSYYDHPPFVAWLFKLGEQLPLFMLKWPAVIMGHLALLVWSRFLFNIGFSKGQIRVWFLLAVMAPLVGLSAMVLTPDLPLLFFFSLAVYFFERALNTGRARYYMLFGAALGLGFTSKYHIVLLGPCLIFYLMCSGRWTEVRWRYLGWVFILAVLGAAPVLWWNYQNDWASFRFQINHGMGKKAWKWIWPIEYLASLLLLILPQYWKTFFKAIKFRQQTLLISLALPVLLFFLISSFRSKVEANWTQLAFLPALSLIAFYEQSLRKASVALGIWTTSLLIVLYYWFQPWFPGCPEKLCEPFRYKALVSVSREYRPFWASNYQMAAYLWFNTKQRVFKLYDMSRVDYFDTFRESKPDVREFYLAKHPETRLPTWLAEDGYRTESVKMIDQDLVLLRVFK